MSHWKYPPLNSGGFLSALLSWEAFYMAETSTDAPAIFRIAAVGLGFVFGIMGWWSFRKFGLWARKGVH